MFAPIETDRLTLRRLVPDDAPAVFAYRSDPGVSRYQLWRPGTVESVRNFLKELAAVRPDTPGTWLQLAIVFRKDNAVIGDCGIRFPTDDVHQVELGITLAPKFHRKGLAFEVLRAVLGYVFDTLHKHRAFASIDPRNRAAISLMNRLGFRQAAHFTESILVDGACVDDLVFGMLDREWQSRCSPAVN